MLLELLFFLLPVAAASGWYAGRRDPKPIKRSMGRRYEIPKDYLKGLNYLINEQSDKAIELFIQMLEVDSNTVETHFALGSLFRRRGEVDRAIRIHQNLIARPTLTPEQRAQALFALGQDYHRAGLFDRAETLFAELIDTGPHTEPALRHLIDIYQQERDWDKAIFTARRLEARTGKDLKSQVAQYYCELADQAIQHKELPQALRMVKKAQSADKQCVRASLLEGRVEFSAGNYKQAIKTLHRIEQQDPAFLSEAIPLLQKCYEASSRQSEFTDYLNHVMEQHDSISVILMLTDLVEKKEGDDKATEFLASALKHRPSLRAMDRLIELNLDNPNEAVREKLRILKDVSEKLLQNRAVYQCDICGFSGKTLHWQCPSCKKWNSIKPIQGVEGE